MGEETGGDVTEEDINNLKQAAEDIDAIIVEITAMQTELAEKFDSLAEKEAGDEKKEEASSLRDEDFKNMTEKFEEFKTLVEAYEKDFGEKLPEGESTEINPDFDFDITTYSGKIEEYKNQITEFEGFVTSKEELIVEITGEESTKDEDLETKAAALPT